MDRDLVVRARAGDRDAFSQLATASIGRLNAVARLIVRDDGRAEDAVQDALVDAWLDLRGLRDPDRFDAWLNRSWSTPVRTWPGAPAAGCGSKFHCCRHTAGRPRHPVLNALSDELERGFRRLTIEQRTVIVLVYYLDLPLTDAAATLASRSGR